jgi:hypothetical protein
MLFFQVCHYLVTQKLQVEQHTLVLNATFVKKSHMLLPYSMEEITQQTLLQLRIAVEIIASSSSVILWWVQKLL